MHASLRREVQSKVSGPGSADRLPPAQADQARRQDLSQLGQALLGGHEIRVQRIATRKAVIETAGTDAGLLVHPAATAYVPSPALLEACPRSIQPRTVSGSLSS
jgi:hypothetical protein